MDEATWSTFCDKVPAPANERLTVMLEHLVAEGEASLRRAGCRRDATGPGPGGMTIEARGTVLRGHVSLIGRKEHFFVTAITVDRADETGVQRSVRSRARPDERQGKLEI